MVNFTLFYKTKILIPNQLVYYKITNFSFHIYIYNETKFILTKSLTYVTKFNIYNGTIKLKQNLRKKYFWPKLAPIQQITNYSMNRRSMGGRIYQQQTFKPKLITLKNPQQRKIQYPIKGDTSFEPSEYGRKHYFSPKHSAIHSIIFNEDYKKLMEEKSNILKRLNVDPNFSHQNHREKAMEYRKYTENQGKNNIKMLDSYLNDSIVMDSKVNNSTNPFPPYNIFSSSGGSLNQKVQRGRLFRQGSMNEVLKPFEPLEKSSPMGLSRGSSSVMDSPILSRNRSLNFEHSMNRNNSLNAQVILTDSNFPRKINPSNLNSIF